MTSAFASRFAAQIRGVLSEHAVQGYQLADRLGRSKGYVSERLSGLRPMDTDMIDAVAELVGMETLDLVAEVGRRMGLPTPTRSEPATRQSAPHLDVGEAPL